MARSSSVLIALFLFWLLLSGLFTPFLVLAGAGSALAVTLLARRMDVIDHEGFPIHLGWRALFSYWPWLAKEIFKSTWDVSKRILDPRLPISPTLVEFGSLHTTAAGLAGSAMDRRCAALEGQVSAVTRSPGEGDGGRVVQ